MSTTPLELDELPEFETPDVVGRAFRRFRRGLIVVLVGGTVTVMMLAS